MALAVSVCVCVCVAVVTTGRILAKIKNVKNYVYRFRHSPSNYVTAKIELSDLDLHFRGKN